MNTNSDPKSRRFRLGQRSKATRKRHDELSELSADASQSEARRSAHERRAERRFLDLEEAARIIGISQLLLSDLLTREELHGHVFSGTRRFALHEIESLIVRTFMRRPGGRIHVVRLPKRFADPHFFRIRSRPDSIARLDGQQVVTPEHRHNGAWERSVTFEQIAAPGPPETKSPDPKTNLRRYRRRAAALLSRYRREGWCTPKELRTIEALMCKRHSLRKHSRDEKVAPAAIESRIAGLSQKAPEFFNGWRRAHRNRRRK